jgi:hypothetical protein
MSCASLDAAVVRQAEVPTERMDHVEVNRLPPNQFVEKSSNHLTGTQGLRFCK